MSTVAPLQNTAAKSPPLSTSAHLGLLLQRTCACGSPTSSLSGECAECAGEKLQRSPLNIGAPDDRFEQEADRVADAVVAGEMASLSLSSVPVGNVQREEVPKEKIDEDKFKEAGGKLLEALLQTPLGKDLQKAIEQDKLVKGASEVGKDIAAPFISTVAGKIITGVAAAGAVAALAVEYKKLPHKELPAQIPEIPLDGLTPGLSVQITYKGPMDQPTEASITVKYSEQAPKGVGDKKDGPSAAEKYRAETAHMAAADAKLRAGMSYPPGSPEDLRQKAEQGDEKRAAAKFAGGPDLDAMVKKYPGLKSPQPKPGEQPEMPKSSFGFTPPVILGDQLKYKLPTEKKKKEDEPTLQRKDAGERTEAAENDTAPPIVHEVLNSPGQPLDAATRAFMEPRFGHDFSQVRVHSGAAAEQSAREVNAQAYTVGHDVVFGVGRFAPGTPEGRRLIAHELTHVVQQTDEAAPPRRPPALKIGDAGQNLPSFLLHAKSPREIQARPTPNTLGNLFEQGADQLARQVLCIPDPERRRDDWCGDGYLRCRTATEQLSPKQGIVQTKWTDFESAGAAYPRTPPILERPTSSGVVSSASTAPPAELQADEIGNRIASEISGTAVTAGPLPEAIRSVAERHLGVNLIGTKLVTSTRAPHGNISTTHAIALGSMITYTRGQPSTKSSHSRHILGHELTHVAQQRASGIHTPQGYRQSKKCTSAQAKSGIEPGNSLAYQLAFKAKNELEKPIPKDGSYGGLESVLAWYARKMWGMDTRVWAGARYFVSKTDQTNAQKWALEAFTLAQKVFEGHDYEYDCLFLCKVSDYGYVEPLGDKTIHLCPSAIGVGGDFDATVNPKVDVDTAAVTILHEMFHVLKYKHPEAEEYAQFAYELAFKKTPPISKVDSSSGGTPDE